MAVTTRSKIFLADKPARILVNVIAIQVIDSGIPNLNPNTPMQNPIKAAGKAKSSL